MAKLERIIAKVYRIKDGVIAKVGLEQSFYQVIAPDGQVIRPNPKVRQLNPYSNQYFKLEEGLDLREPDGSVALLLVVELPKTINNYRGYPPTGTWQIRHTDWPAAANFSVVYTQQKDFVSTLILRLQKGELAGNVNFETWV